MIAVINQQTQYGRQGQISINLHDELSDAGIVCYAHSVQDAVKWLTDFPLFSDATIDDLGDGRIMVTSLWTPFEPSVFFPDDKPKATHTRERAIVSPVNTIYENTGFAGYK